MAAAAHSANQLGERHDLVEHLRGVAERAHVFARAFGGGDLAHSAGLYHDLGKFHPEFQEYLRYCETHPGERGPRVDHKAAGAEYAQRISGPLRLLIMAHHGGLRGPSEVDAKLSQENISSRVVLALELATAALPELAQEAQVVGAPDHATRDALSHEFFLRMLFSCLVDADFLDTEAHFDDQKSMRRESTFDAAALLARLREHQERIAKDRDDALTLLRRRVAVSCEAAGEREPGIYRMTVPTGGGKTLAGMGFALRHAAAHGKRRVVVAIPYTSITEQTARTYREVFRDDGVVLEHHSAAAPPENDDGSPTGDQNWQRLAAENWDAPIVVTTTVQLFESLFGRRVSRSRKLHNLTNSVVILDEVQMLPPGYLEPILDVLHRLASDYGTTFLLSTATQPQFSTEAFRALPEIAPDPPALFRELRRVDYAFPAEPWTWDELVAAVSQERQVMAILNTKKDARAVLDALGDPDALHLSTLLCGAHRQAVLAEVKERLKTGKPCRLVATQVVEAGVDLDFPAVFRAMGPLDRIIQAAGRCNREGRSERGRVVVFQPAAGGMPPGVYKTATQQTKIELAKPEFDIHDADALGPWFRGVYDTVATDAYDIQKLRRALDFTEVAHRFRMIADDTEDVVAPYGNPDERAEILAKIRARQGSARLLLRRLQPYTVALRRRDISGAAARGLLAPVMDGVWEWVGNPASYDAVRGLNVDGVDEELIIV
jgi:CRISPR-associated endonuclease/helicase Cas3